TDTAPVRQLGLPVLLALAAGFFLFFNVGAVWTYVERMGALAQWETQDIGTGLAVGVAFGIPGALLASWFGNRMGRVLPLTIGATGTIVALFVLGTEFTIISFTLAMALYNFVWNFSLAFQYAAVNAVDDSGRAVAAAPAFHGVGAAVGPATVALFVTETDLQVVNIMAAIATVLSLLLFVVALDMAGKSRSRS
ncbi:MAG: hypothetical protein AAGF35_12175, partial [Pseudomonadota bacterium]